MSLDPGGMFPANVVLYVDLYDSGPSDPDVHFDSEGEAFADAVGRLALVATYGPAGIGGTPEYRATAALSRSTGIDGDEYQCRVKKLVFRFYSYSASCKLNVSWNEVARYQLDGGAFTTSGTSAQSWDQPGADLDGSHIDGSFDRDDPTTWAVSDDFTSQVVAIPASGDYATKQAEAYIAGFGPSFVYGFTAPTDGTALSGGIPEPDPLA